MSEIYRAYDFTLDRLPELYRRLNKVIKYPDGMTTSLGIIYWGREEHYPGIESALLLFINGGVERMSDLSNFIYTPSKVEKTSKDFGITKSLLRILAHDIKLWLPDAVPLERLERLNIFPESLKIFLKLGLTNQLEVISAGHTRDLRQQIALDCNLPISEVCELVKLCDFYRMGRNLDHIRSRLFYNIGLNTYEEWAGKTSEDIITLFSRFVLEHDLEETRLVPWPKEVRNGIEWARMHLEVFAVQW
jgi:hypothetical protein